MSYIGNQVTSVPHVIDTFSGDSGTVRFGPLVRAPAGVAAIAVFISGSYKTPGVDYTLNGDYILSTQVPSDGSVTPNKFSSSANSKISSSGIVGSIIFGG